MKITKLFTAFIESEKAGGMLLVIVTVTSMILANTAFGPEYINFWQQPMGSHTLTEWINDGLMAIFFLLIGLELEREIYIGELSDLRSASLPIFGAIGGMVVPAAIYMSLNMGTATQDGAGIPMATDIAFAVGILSLLGSRVPIALKVFLTALAVIDDLGAIIVIALFYSKDIAVGYLLAALGVWGFLFVLNRLKIYSLVPYLLGGAVMWYLMLNSGVHATITGVILAFVIPFGGGEESSISYKLQEWLHAPVAFFILPVFALAKTCIPIESGWQSGLMATASLGIIIGLVVGKPLGIWVFAMLGCRAKLCALPQGIRWKHILGVGFLGGIGFTMSIFITLLAFDDAFIINEAKMSILIASLIAGTIGFVMLKFSLSKRASLDAVEE